MQSDFGPLLRRWRSDRRFTQERLALEAEVSTRHLSCLESGKASPSREMVLALASTLDLPLRDRNVLLGAAGFQSQFGGAPLDSAEMASIRRALDLILAKQEPYGAVVFDRLGNVQQMNQGARLLLGYFVDLSTADPLALANVHHAVFSPRGLRPVIVNWEEVAGLLVERLHREIALHPEDHARREMRDALLAYPGLPVRFRGSSSAQVAVPVVPVHLRKNGRDVRLFTTLTALGTPLDVTAQEATIETYFPMDAEAEAFIQELTSS